MAPKPLVFVPGFPGSNVTAVQNPLTSFADDVAATNPGRRMR